MKYVLIVIVMLAIALVFALVKYEKLVVEDATAEEKDIFCNSITRLEHVLEEEGQKIGTYNIEAYVENGKISFMEIATDKTVGGVKKRRNITNYYMEKRGLTKKVAIAGITAIVFMTEMLFYVLAT